MSIVDIAELPWEVPGTPITLEMPAGVRIWSVIVTMPDEVTVAVDPDPPTVFKLVLAVEPDVALPLRSEMRVTVVPPAIANIKLEFREGTSGGRILYEVELDDTGASVFVSLVWSTTQKIWIQQDSNYNGTAP